MEKSNKKERDLKLPDLMEVNHDFTDFFMEIDLNFPDFSQE